MSCCPSSSCRSTLQKHTVGSTVLAHTDRRQLCDRSYLQVRMLRSEVHAMRAAKGSKPGKAAVTEAKQKVASLRRELQQRLSDATRCEAHPSHLLLQCMQICAGVQQCLPPTAQVLGISWGISALTMLRGPEGVSSTQVTHDLTRLRVVFLLQRRRFSPAGASRGHPLRWPADKAGHSKGWRGASSTALSGRPARQASCCHSCMHSHCCCAA